MENALDQIEHTLMKTWFVAPIVKKIFTDAIEKKQDVIKMNKEEKNVFFAAARLKNTQN
jgi:hypothetical protein